MPRPHQLVVFGGFLGANEGAGDTWSCSFKTVATPTVVAGNSEGTLDVETLQEILNDTIEPAIRAMWADPALGVTSAAKLTYVKYNQIGENGKYVHQTTVGHYYGEPLNGPTAPTNQHPFQVCRVVTLHTEASRGRASKGRMFLPSPSSAIDPATGKAQAGTGTPGIVVTTMLSAVREVDVSNAISIRPVVLTNLPTGDQPSWRDITRVSVDDVLDIQRRRAAQLPRTRTFPAAGVS